MGSDLTLVETRQGPKISHRTGRYNYLDGNEGELGSLGAYDRKDASLDHCGL